ncbi:MAG: asparagine synthase-related protein [Jaaginema sp. PMC 1079.18]|nr:asparagine synthase-related protein [Jaaginema sp. PMC 1080.18]MEC4852600.1 asparagine synthase-related protein [Jaaginema sp. PMC 1079.18]MEC4868734.1 asparagine synthase-related protein [Jaaginema sp. PMC 1078.18]
MSGICGILHFDGTAVEPALIQRWTQYLTYRGGDDWGCWCRGNVGLGHTLLRTTREAATEKQPYSFDGKTYITADLRLDDRETLVERLQAADRVCSLNDPDVVLLLQAYHLWGENCLDYLLGDFAFALWDAQQQRLFCARDRFGVKPFFYTYTGKFLAFSNTINCLRLHPEISNELNELAIADFLLFDTNQDLATTTFRQIQRLQAAQTLTLTRDGQKKQRQYWQLTLPNPIRLPGESDYIEGFEHYFNLALGDRLRLDRVALFLSGGLDSAAIAHYSHNQPTPPQLHAFTIIYNHLIPDDEKEYAQATTQTLNIPHSCFAADDYALYAHHHQPAYQFPEPQPIPRSAVHFDWLRQVAQHSSVALYGQGGDEGFKMATVSEAWRGMPFFNLLADIALSWGKYKQPIPWGTGIRNLIQKYRQPPPETFTQTPWLNEDFAHRWQLSDRVATILAQSRPPLDQPPRSRAFYSLPPSPLWNLNFETYDPGVSRLPLEVRLPFLDLRLLNYLLALPPLPWCIDKTLLRIALRDKLPARVCDRPKTPLSLEPAVARLAQGDRPWQVLPHFTELDPYIDRDKLQQITSGKMDTQQVWRSLRPLSLGYWLKQLANPKIY